MLVFIYLFVCWIIILDSFSVEPWESDTYIGI